MPRGHPVSQGQGDRLQYPHQPFGDQLLGLDGILDEEGAGKGQAVYGNSVPFFGATRHEQQPVAGQQQVVGLLGRPAQGRQGMQVGGMAMADLEYRQRLPVMPKRQRSYNFV